MVARMAAGTPPRPAACDTGLGQGTQMLAGRQSVRHQFGRILIMQLRQREAAAFGDGDALIEQRRRIQLLQFLQRAQAPLGVRVQPPAGLIDPCSHGGSRSARPAMRAGRAHACAHRRWRPSGRPLARASASAAASRAASSAARCSSTASQPRAGKNSRSHVACFACGSRGAIHSARQSSSPDSKSDRARRYSPFFERRRPSVMSWQICP